MGHQGSPLTDAEMSADWVRPTLVYRLSWPGYLTVELEPVPSPEPVRTKVFTPETAAGELFFEQSSELEEEVEVGVIGTALVFPEDPLVLFNVFGFLFLV